MREIRFIDTFAGIGGFHIAMRKACHYVGEGDIIQSCVASVEIDDAACKTYEKNLGRNPKGDMTKIPPEGYPDHDFLFGGFPCQPISRNGRIYNFSSTKTLDDDDRSKLCFRLFDILRAKRPKFFVFENVKELLTIKNKDGSLFLDTILTSIDDCDYDVKYQLLDTADFGRPQQRKRVYLVGSRKDLGLKGAYEFPSPRPLDSCVSSILEDQVAPKYLLENLWRNRKNVRIGGTRLESIRAAYDSGKWARPTTMTDKITPVAIIYGDTPSGAPRQQDKMYSVMGISPTIATFSTPAFDVASGWRTLTPRECARLQGFPVLFSLPERDSLAYKQLGNAVTVDVAQAVIEQLVRLAIVRT